MKSFLFINRTFLFSFVLLSVFFTSCKDEEENPPVDPTENLVFIASGYAAGSGAFVKLWAKDSLFAGYNFLYVQLLDSATNALIDDAHVELTPMMDMGTHMHSAPFENPESADAVDGLFPCAVVFQMPGDMGWSLKVHIHNHVNNKEGEANLTFAVKNPEDARTRVITTLNDSSKIILSYVQPQEPVVGINDFELTIHRMASMMSYPADGSYTVEIEPEMPSMGHGSPNNVNPVHESNGHYKGKVNFTMTGEWRIHLLIKKGSEVADSTSYFDVVL